MGGTIAENTEFHRVLARAMACLARREHSCRELQAKLVHKGAADDVARAVVAQLEQQRLLSDQRFAEAWVRSRADRWFGPLKIRAELAGKGVADGVIEQALAEYAGHWPEAAQAWVARRGQPGMDRKAQARIYRGGCNRGFTHEQMMNALARLNSGD